MENAFIALANILGGLTCLPLGLAIQAGKLDSLNHEEVKARFDIKATSKFTGWVILVIPSIILLAACIPMLLGIFPLVMLTVSWGLFTIIVVVGAIYLNTSSRFKRTE
ncbi:MAG: DUF3784 domain-containing protein [Oscillospiraceae bacterium]|jgi:uncharacterized membrane protein|nr:DUF3784 domain-containing protein [Oscillospiraceae bacterium]